jgi:hypothetical protein
VLITARGSVNLLCYDVITFLAASGDGFIRYDDERNTDTYSTLSVGLQ